MLAWRKSNPKAMKSKDASTSGTTRVPREPHPRKLPKIGAHLSIAGGHHHAVFAAAAASMTTVQVFTKANQQWKARELTDDNIRAFHEALADTGVADPVGHNSYLINLASPDDSLWNRSIDAMTLELERAEALGLRDLVAHPGAHLGSGEEQGLERIAAALDQIHRRTSGFHSRIALESTAGQGSCLGYRLEHLHSIVDQVAAPERLSVCLDTCHLFAAGYAWDDLDSYNHFIAEFDQRLGISRLRVWHLNDSLKARGSRVDRHAGIGRGHMGIEPFRCILNDCRFSDVPLILETPKGKEDGQDLDVLNRSTLEQLVERPGRTAGKDTRRRSARNGR